MNKRISQYVLLLTGCLLSVSVYAQNLGVLDEMDSNQDGVISRSEFSPRMGPRREALLERADQNGDGVIARSEFEALMEDMAARRIERGVDRFEALDRNQDGQVSEEEMIDARFARLDLNNDGQITRRELARSWKRERRGERRGR